MRDQTTKTLPKGKLPLDLLEKLLKRYDIPDKSVVVGPRIGEDAAVLEIPGSSYLIAKTDPITFTADEIGWYAVHVNANDIATMGGVPRWFLVTLLLPEKQTTPEKVDEIFRDIYGACKELGVSLIGGHTEVTSGFERPILVGQMLGEVEKNRLVRSDGAREGDAILLTKGIAIEGTAILARERATELAGAFGEEMVARCKRFIYDPGISVLKESRIALGSSPIHAMHDPTEGGLATALHELARASGFGITVDARSIAVFPETQRLCQHYGLDPLGLIASGALLIVLEFDDAPKVQSALEQGGISSRVIGKVVGRDEGVKVNTASGPQDLPIYEQDEITRV